jgi:hypothetical protein
VQTTVWLVFRDSFGCNPIPRIRLRLEHPECRSMSRCYHRVKADYGTPRISNLGCVIVSRLDGLFVTPRGAGHSNSSRRRSDRRQAARRLRARTKMVWGSRQGDNAIPNSLSRGKKRTVIGSIQDRKR